MFDVWFICRDCEGTGKHGKKTCPVCKGNAKRGVCNEQQFNEMKAMYEAVKSIAYTESLEIEHRNHCD